jgi:hypothetical protein
MLRKTVLVRALQIAFSTAALTMAVTPSVMAQSNSTGVIYGHVDAPAGASVTLTNTDTGLKRTAGVDASGSYRVTALPVGHYKVELTRNGSVASTSEVDVVLGQGVDASFANAANVAKVQVTGRRNRIDVSNANNGAVFSAKELAKLPVQPTLTSIVLLAPNTTKGDAAYGNTASFGGSGVSENSFYLNGFPITNPLSQLGSMELPFGAIQQASVLTGGFGAEFGRSIGGVMSVTTKSGTNNWEAGATYSTEPNSLRAKQHNLYYADTGSELDGMMDRRRDNRSLSTSQYGAYVGGPIIQDKLFMFVSADQTVTKDAYVGATTQTNLDTIGQSGWNSNRTLENRWVGKLDWNINDSNRLEFTSAGDNSRTRYQKYGYALNPGMDPLKAAETLDGTPTSNLYTSASAKNLGPTDPEFPGAQGAEVNMLKYTGNVNDDLTVTALYGEMTTKRGVSYEHVGAYQTSTLPPTITTGTSVNQWEKLDKGLYRNFNPFPGYVSEPGQDKVKAGRLDLEWKLGKHTLRAGFDESRLNSSTAGQVISGGDRWIYRNIKDKAHPEVEQSVTYSRKAILANYGGSGADGYYASHLIFNSVTAASSTQSAQYIEDRFQATNNLLLTFGLRNDAYSNTNGDGEKFIDMKHQIAPRFQASWDVNGDASFKVFGSAGRYYLQLPTQVAARAAARSTYTQQDFTYTGIDPTTGVPTGVNPINTPLSADGEYGQKKNVRSVVEDGLKPNYQDELTLGFEKSLTPEFNFGAKVTYRKLGAGIDDSCDVRPMYAFALAHGIDVQNPGAMNCFIYNPGRDVTVWIDGNDAEGNPVVTGKGQMAHFTAAEIGEPKAKRTYAAVDVFMEHPLRNGWFGRVNYTLSRNSGNMEGQTRSDTGQTDVGTSAAWDFPEFAPGSDGLLPNDRKHQLKLFGFYQLTPEWSVGGNALIQSGRPRLCLGTNDPSDSGTNPDFPMGSTYWSPGYGAEYYYCDGHPSPRGSMGRLPMEKRLDLNLTYAPALVKGLALKVDVFNVLNAQSPLTQDPTFDYYTSPEPTYNEYTSYQSPRSAKFTVEYNHKF